MITTRFVRSLIFYFIRSFIFCSVVAMVVLRVYKKVVLPRTIQQETHNVLNEIKAMRKERTKHLDSLLTDTKPFNPL
jgi:hypothetical protein